MDSKSNYKTYKNDCLLKVADLSCEHLELNNMDSFPQIINVNIKVLTNLLRHMKN